MKSYFSFVLIVAFLLGTVIVSAQPVLKSKGNGGGSWLDPATWDLGRIPAKGDSVVILGGDSVYYHPATPTKDTCQSLTVLPNGIGAQPTNADSGLTITGVTTLQANAWYYNFAAATVPGATRVIDYASTVVLGNSNAGGSGNLEFGNLIVNRQDGGMTAGGDLLIHGDLTVNPSAGNYLRGSDKHVAGPRYHHVFGNVHVIQGTWSCIDVGSDSTGPCTWEVDGNVDVTSPPGLATHAFSRIGPFTSASARGYGTFIIHGNLDLSNGRLQIGASSTRGRGYGVYNLYGDLTFHDGADVRTNILSPAAINFVGTGIQRVTLHDSDFNMSTILYDTIATTSHVILDFDSAVWKSTDTTGGTGGGGWVVKGILEMRDSAHLKGTTFFELDSGATLMTGMPAGIAVWPDSTSGCLQTGIVGARTFHPKSNIVFNGSVPQKTGNGLPPIMNNLTIDNVNGVRLDTSATVNGTVTVQNGALTTGGNILTLGPDATLSEPIGDPIIGNVRSIRYIGAPATELFGGLGLSIITSSVAPDTTTVTRVTGTAAMSNGNSGILRYYSVDAKNNTGLDAQLEFRYDGSELNGLVADKMILFQSVDNGTTWNYRAAHNDGVDFTLTASDFHSFAWYTAGDALHPLDAGVMYLSYVAGWNMLSLPSTVPDNHRAVLFPTASSKLFYYDRQYKESDTMANTVGYWLKFPTDNTMLLSGNERVHDSMKVIAGWNMIGSISHPVAITDIKKTIGVAVLTKYYSYNNGYAEATTIEPGKSYWIKTSAIGSLVLDTATSLLKNPAEDLRAQMSSVSITGANGAHQTLYVGAAASGLSPGLYELPPVPPEGFDVRFASQRTVEAYQPNSAAETYPVIAQGLSYPVTIAWHLAGDAGRSLVLMNGSEKHALNGDGKMVMNTPVRELSLVSSKMQAAPVQFTLSRNYPNPFNPTTTIEVGLPVQSRISLRVYNVLGQQVAQVAGGVYDKGYYEFMWSGANDQGVQAGSGVYFYRLEATSMTGGVTFTDLQKMVMMK